MRVALLADIHGNLSALRAVEKDMEYTKPDEVWFLGDAIGKGPNSDACFDWVRQRCAHWIGGNWDFGVAKRLFPRDGLYQRQLGESRLQYLLSLPEEYHVVFSGLRLRLIHGRPVLWELPVGIEPKEELRNLFKGKNGEEFNAVIYADMHRQLLRTLDWGHLYNIGSVGNTSGPLGAYYALMEGEMTEEPAPFEMRMRRVPYDPAESLANAKVFFGTETDRYLSYEQELLTGVYVRRGQNTPPKRF